MIYPWQPVFFSWCPMPVELVEICTAFLTFYDNSQMEQSKKPNLSLHLTQTWISEFDAIILAVANRWVNYSQGKFTGFETWGKSSLLLWISSVTLTKLLAQLSSPNVVAFLQQLPRLGWLASQAYLLLVEIGKYAIGHEMSNQQWWLPATSQLHLFFTTQSLFRTSFSTLLAGGCPNVVILAQPPLLQRSGLTWAKWQARLAKIRALAK